MHFRITVIFSLFLAMLLVSEDALGQRRYKKYKRRRSKSKKVSSYRGSRVRGRFRPYQYVGFGVNAMNYFGDLAPVNSFASTDISFTRPGFGFMYAYKFHKSAAIRLAFNGGRLKGDDVTASSDPDGENYARYLRNLSFRNDIKEVSLGFEFYLFPDRGGPSQRTPINAYLYLGAAIYHHNPKGKVPDFDYQSGTNEALPQAGEWVALQPLGTEGQFIEGSGNKPYDRIQFAVPVSIGATLRLPGNFNAGIEFGLRYTFTDYLDDVSTSYVDLGKFDNQLARVMSDRAVEPIAILDNSTRNFNSGSSTFSDGNDYFYSTDLGSGNDGAIRGNPDNDDFYFVTQIRLTYILGRARRSTAKFR
ncbi:MAG: hypothetical protein KI790_00300 [Cyclobacteriaceae bacterium]|nr:hypothetical protein [Cyclobacteriaceae bacterium HetDA_MAG_MS6]